MYSINDMRQYLLSFVNLQSGNTLLDIGCGKGWEIAAIAKKHTDSSIKLYGIDKAVQNDEMWKRIIDEDSRISFLCENVEKGLPYNDNQFNVVFSNNFLECIIDMNKFIQEVHRICAKEAIVIFAHTDWDSIQIDGDDKELIREMVHKFGDRQQKWMPNCDVWIGRRIGGYFESSGLFHGQVHPFTIIDLDYNING